MAAQNVNKINIKKEDNVDDNVNEKKKDENNDTEDERKDSSKERFALDKLHDALGLTWSEKVTLLVNKLSNFQKGNKLILSYYMYYNGMRYSIMNLVNYFLFKSIVYVSPVMMQVGRP